MPGKILIIDDEPDVTKVLAIRLKARGYEVYVAEDGKEGLSLLKSTNPDLLLLDHNLPDMTGATFVRSAQSQGLAPAPVILISASTASLADKAQECRAQDFIAKPIEPEELYEKVERNIRRI